MTPIDDNLAEQVAGQMAAVNEVAVEGVNLNKQGCKSQPLDSKSPHVVIVADASAVDSPISSLVGSLPSSMRVFQAHLWHYDRGGGPVLALRACNMMMVKRFSIKIP